MNEIHIREGEAVSEILNFADANGIDLIVLSTHGHTGIREDLIGSTPELVIRQARVPVLVGRA